MSVLPKPCLDEPMKSLLKEMKEYRRETVLAPLFKMLEAIFELFVPLVMKQIIDVGIPEKNKGTIVSMSLILFALAVIGLVCAITAQWFSARAATGFASKLRSMVFRHIQTLSFQELDTIGNSTLITRMTSDINQIQNGVNLTLRLFMRSPFVVFGAMIMAFTIDVKCAWIFAVVIPLLSIVVFGVMLYTRPLYKKVQDGLDKITGKTRENLTGVRVIRAFHREEDEERTFGLANEDLRRMQLFVGRISAIMNPVTYVLINAAVVVLIYTGAIRVNVGILTQGAVVALVNYMNQILVELVKLANLIIQMTRAVACGNRVEAILKQGSEAEREVLAEKADSAGNNVAEKAVSSGNNGPEKDSGSVESSGKEGENAGHIPRIVFDHVSMHYAGTAEESVTDVSFTADAGETVGIIGGTGSGKSTLVNLIPGFYPVTSGSLRIDGREVSDYSVMELRKRVGIVMQKAALLTGTIRDNVLLGKPDATDEEVWDAIRKAQAEDFVLDKKGKLGAKVEQDGRNFSGGQKQRLSIARALVRKPDILILDDSASALDFATDAALRKEISESGPEMTVFIVSQRTASIMGADRIIVLDDGSVAGIGTHAELLENCEVYREIYESQLN